MSWSGRPRVGLRQRVTLMFGLVALAMSVLLGVTTYVVARETLWAQRQQNALGQTFFNARTVDQVLSGPGAPSPELLETLDARGGESSHPMLLWNGRWYDSRYEPSHESLPAPFLSAVRARDPVMQRIPTEAGLGFAVAVPLDRGVYIEVSSLQQLDSTLTSLGAIFLGTTTMTTLVGLLIGGWAARRSLRPLTSVTAAAAAVAEGRLDARLQAGSDPDLGPIAEAFNTTAARLQARVERDARFAGNVSHELRTPITTMVNAVDILQARAGELDEESREVLALLAADVHRFAQMVEDLLEISRLDSGAAEVRREEVPLRAFVDGAVERYAGRRLDVSGGDDPVVMVDRRRMERVIGNLVSNAETHGRGLTSVSVEVDDGRVRVVVDDAGPGVPPEQRAGVFERFGRVPRARDDEVGGVGLGLALVAEEVGLHQGRVWVEDSPEGGARFVVELPREGP